MSFTQQQLEKFVRFHEAMGAQRGGEAPVLNHEFCVANNLRRDDLALIVSMRAQMEAAARAAGLIA